MVDTALINSYIYYKKTPIPGRETVKHKDFQLSLVRGILNKYSHNYILETPQVVESIDGMSQNCQATQDTGENFHLPVPIKNIRSRCENCKIHYGHDTNNKSNMKCISCGIFLCLTTGRNCFKVWHEQRAVEIGWRKRQRVSRQ
jgi:hypothetical protein